MKAEEFEKLFSDTVQVALDMLQGYSEQDLREMVDKVLEFT
jgi:pyoverdine/dityrosine biosynthesis protein Dit1